MPTTVTDDWFWDWVTRHLARFPRSDWPSLDSEFWSTLRHIFVVKGVTEAVADAASVRLFESPPAFPDAHPKALLEQVRDVWRDSEVKDRGSAGYANVGDARTASKGCCYCGGDGLTGVFHRRPDAANAPTVSAYCICDAGRMTKDIHMKSQETRDLVRRIPDLRNVLDGVSPYLAEPPRAPEPYQATGRGGWDD